MTEQLGATGTKEPSGATGAKEPSGPTGATGHTGLCLPRKISEIEYAINRQDHSKVKILIHEVNNILDPDGNYPIHVCAKGTSIEIIKLLLVNGANINALNHWNITPLMYAGFYGNTKIINFLLDQGADKSLKNYWGATAKDKAAENNHSDCVILLS